MLLDGPGDLVRIECRQFEWIRETVFATYSPRGE
jgi:hypothetical protein